MIRRIRRTRTLLATCALPLGAVHALLLAGSVFLHAPGEDHEQRLAGVPGPSHHHDLRLPAGGGPAGPTAGQCPGCNLERTSAVLPQASSAIASVLAPGGRLPRVEAAPARPSLPSSSPRAPPRF